MAQVSRAAFASSLATKINDNASGEITAQDVREMLTDLEDSAVWYDEVTQEIVEDWVGAMFTGNTETRITVTYQDGDSTVDFVVDDDLANYDNSNSLFQVQPTEGPFVDGDKTLLDAALQPGDNATELDGTAWRLFYTDGSGDVTELALGTDGQVLTSTGTSTAPAFEDAPGASGGDSWGDAVDADIVPDADGTRDLGSSSNRFAELHVDQIDLNGTTLDGTALADPGADAILAWDDGDTAGTEAQWWTLGAGLATDGSSLGVDGVLEDLDTLGAPASDGQIIVATGAGAFAYESGSTARTSLGAAALGANEFTGAQDFNGQSVEGFLNNVVTSVTGTLTTTAHSGNILVTSGNVTVPTTPGFNCVIRAGGAHTVTFDGNTSAAMADGDIMTVFVQSATVIHAVLTAAADKVTFS